jgi:hypothetical protein
MSFHRGVDFLFTTEELLAGFMLVLDDRNARRAVFEWLETFGFYVSGNRVMEPAGGWSEFGASESAAAEYDPWVSPSSPANEFLTSHHGQPIADDLPELVRAMFVRYTGMHYELVAIAAPQAISRFRAAGLELPALPKTPESRQAYLATVRSVYASELAC